MPIATDSPSDSSSATSSLGDSLKSSANGSASGNSTESSSFPPLEHFRIPNIPPAAYYIPDFITPEEEEYLLKKIAESPQPKWKTVGSGRRLQYWGGTMSKKGVLLPEQLPDFLTSFPNITERIEAFLAAASSNDDDDNDTGKGKGKKLDINQVLVNEYQPGQGISPHEDGPAFRPLVSTVSLGSHTVLDIYHYLSTTSPSPPMIATPFAASDAGEAPDAGNAGRPIAAVPLAHLLVMPRSLLILSSSLYTSHLHAIASTTKDVVISPTPSTSEEASRGTSEGQGDEGGVQIANLDLLGDAEVVDAIRSGRWEGERGTRTSLTFRQAEKVLKGGTMSMIGGALRRS